MKLTRQCLHLNGRRKTVFRSRAAANKARIQLIQHSGLPVRVYECARCGGWHLTTQAKARH